MFCASVAPACFKFQRRKASLNRHDFTSSLPSPPLDFQHQKHNMACNQDMDDPGIMRDGELPKIHDAPPFPTTTLHELPPLQESPADRAFGTYELVEMILLQLNIKDIIAMREVSSYIRDLIKGSKQIHGHVCGALPFNHEVTWKAPRSAWEDELDEDGNGKELWDLPIKAIQATLTAEMILSPKRSCFRVPVVINSALLDVSGGPEDWLWEEVRGRDGCLHITADEAYAIVALWKRDYRIIRYTQYVPCTALLVCRSREGVLLIGDILWQNLFSYNARILITRSEGGHLLTTHLF